MTTEEKDTASGMYASLTEIERLVEAFERAAIPRPEWTHAAHVTVGCWHALHFDGDEALNLMRERILRLNEANGVENTPSNGYHETITVLWLQLIANRIANTPPGADLLDLVNGVVGYCLDKELPLRFYSRDVLFSSEARLAWVEPDIAPLPEVVEWGRSGSRKDGV